MWGLLDYICCGNRHRENAQDDYPTMSRDYTVGLPKKPIRRYSQRITCQALISMSSVSTSPAIPKAIVFDLMGTCVDWYSSILPALESAPAIPALPSESLPQLAIDWRAGFFKETRTRREASQPIEDIDITHRRVLNWLLLAREVTPAQWDDGVRNKLVAAWHQQTGRVRFWRWWDSANTGWRGGVVKGGRMWDLDLRGWSRNISCKDGKREDCRAIHWRLTVSYSQTDPRGCSSILWSPRTFHSTCFFLRSCSARQKPVHSCSIPICSCQLTFSQPDADSYKKALALMQVPPSEAVMVAAHAYDLRAAKGVWVSFRPTLILTLTSLKASSGMKTIYVRRTTEDLGEDMQQVRDDVDFFIDGTKGDERCGFGELADILQTWWDEAVWSYLREPLHLCAMRSADQPVTLWRFHAPWHIHQTRRSCWSFL